MTTTEPICPRCGRLMIRGWDHVDCQDRATDLRAQLAEANKRIEALEGELQDALKPDRWPEGSVRRVNQDLTRIIHRKDRQIEECEKRIEALEGGE